MTAQPVHNPARDVADPNETARIFDRALWASVTDIQDLEILPAASRGPVDNPGRLAGARGADGDGGVVSHGPNPSEGDRDAAEDDFRRQEETFHV